MRTKRQLLAAATAQMRAKLRTEPGRAAYATRKQTVEPVFGQIKERRVDVVVPEP